MTRNEWSPAYFFGSGMLLCVFAFALFMALYAPMSIAASTVDTFNFESAELETRYRGLIAEIRCPKCQNVNIAGSDAPIAKDLRITVHRLLGEGKTDAEILEFLQDRYGDFVLYDPPMRGNTVLLWLVPLIGFAGAVLVIVRLARRRPADEALSREDAQRLDALLADVAPSQSSGAVGNARSAKPRPAKNGVS